MDCLLMHHGIAIEIEEWSGPDNTRPLTEQGKKKVGQVAKGLAVMGLAPTHILTSPFTRAQETAAIVRAILSPSVTLTVCTALEPDERHGLRAASSCGLARTDNPISVLYPVRHNNW